MNVQMNGISLPLNPKEMSSPLMRSIIIQSIQNYDYNGTQIYN